MAHTRLAHFSDLHVLSLAGVGPHRFLNKRLSGWANLRFKRSHVHRPAHVRAIARDISRARIDHVAITGDLTNLALEPEVLAVRSLIEEDLGLSPADVSIVPGNHDLYTRGAMTSRRFRVYFGEFITSDLPEIPVDVGLGGFPYVRLRGKLAVIGVSSAVPRLPFVAAGRLGRQQLDALARAFAHPAVKERTPVVLLHHPAHNPRSRLKSLLEGLSDADRLVGHVVDHVEHGLVLHGHLHRRVRRSITTRKGRVDVVGATSASLEHEHHDRMAGFNLYEFDDAGRLVNVEAHVLDPGSDTFRVSELPAASSDGAHW